MNLFDTNEMHFSTKTNSMKKNFHAFNALGIQKGNKNQKAQKTTLLRSVSKLIDTIDLDDFGIEVLVMKVKQ